MSAVNFAEFVRKCGLSKKRLHQVLYPQDNGTLRALHIFFVRRVPMIWHLYVLLT